MTSDASVEPVKLGLAFSWNCPSCGQRQYSDAWAAEFSIEERETCYRAVNQLEDYEPLPEDWEQYPMHTPPLQVKCSACRQRFRTEAAAGGV